MSEREANERLLRAGIQAFNRGDHDTILAMFDPDVECHIPAALGNPGTWHGHDGYQEMVDGWGEAFSELRNEVVAAEFPDEHHVITEVRQTGLGAGSGVPVEMRIFYMLEVHEGRVTRFHLYPERAEALAAVGAH